jgi:hypothetical protein
MTTVLRQGRLRIAIYSEKGGRHHKPHCHAYLGNAEAVFDLETLKFLANNGFSRKALGMIEEIIESHQEEFLDYWRMLNEEG